MKLLFSNLLFLMSVGILLISACSKDSTTNSKSENGVLSGTVYYNHFDGFSKLDLQTGDKTILKGNGTHYNWHISADGTKLMEMMDGRSDGKPDQIKFVIKDLASGEVKQSFFYRPLNGGSNFQSADLSPDKSMICIFPSFDEGFVFLNATNGQLIAHIDAINGERIPRYQSFAWLPDNSLLFKWKNAIIRGKMPFDQLAIVKEFDTESISDFSVSKDGQKVALNYKDHIALMNTDGSDFYEVTSGEQKESGSAFSPDGRYLLVGTGFNSIGVPGSVPSSQSYMKAIPLDGQTYDMTADNPNVISIIPKGQHSAESKKGLMLWMPQ